MVFIYLLKSEDGRQYVGKTIMDLKSRLRKHRGKQNRESNSATKDFINPTISILEQSDTKDKKEIKEIEGKWMRQIDCCNKIKFLNEEEKKEAQARNMKKYKQTEEGRKKINEHKMKSYYKHREKNLKKMKDNYIQRKILINNNGF